VSTSRTATATPPGAADFTAAWEAFSRATRRARGRSTGPLTEGGLSLAQYHLLESLLDGRERTVSELALAAGVAAPTATRMLDSLVRDGHAARRPSEHDRRAVLVSLTESGLAEVHAAGEHVQAVRRRVRDSLTPAEQEQAARLLRRLAAVLDEEL
jgi:DNA-binding MarR family transcriptional regulator